MLKASARDAPPVADAGFRAVYGEHFPYVANVLRRLGAPPSVLEDLAHDVFLVAYQRFHTFDGRRPIRPWLFGIALRRFTAFRSRAYHAQEVHSETMLEAVAPTRTPDEALEGRQSRELVLKALQSMDLEKRAIFVLVDIDGTAVPEAAEALEIPLNTAYSRLRRAREAFAAEARRLSADWRHHG